MIPVLLHILLGNIDSILLESTNHTIFFILIFKLALTYSIKGCLCLRNFWYLQYRDLLLTS